VLSTARPIILDDLFAGDVAKKGTTSLIETMRQSHHELARLVAEGRKDVEISAMTGFSGNRISVLKSSPAFQELVTHYSEIKSVAYIDTHEKIALLGNEALDALRDDLHDEKLTPSQKLELAKMSLDRSGFGPQTKSTNINFNAPLAGEALAAIRDAVGQKGRVTHLADIDQSIAPAPAVLAAPTPPYEVPAGDGAPLGEVVRSPLAHPADTAEGSTGEGDLF